MFLVTFGYAAMHFLVDFICAWAMLFRFTSGPEGYINILIYNFCAFALQMPLGTMLDAQKDRKRLPLIWSVAGAALTVVGALIHPAVLGLGNALFHVGGGMDVIFEDHFHDRKGADLGIFVAPGAVGLYLGGLLGKSNWGSVPLIAATILVAIPAWLLLKKHQPRSLAIPKQDCGKGLPVLLLCCFAVVVLRSWAGLGIRFPWKAEFGFVSVLAVALGKALGGIAAARFGMNRAMSGSLIPAAICFLLGDDPVFGIIGLLLFNMTMPMTLYLLAKKMPHLPGFSFGLLTFGLFLGFLPVYAGLDLPVTGNIFGCLVSLVSLLLLLLGRKAVKYTVLS